MSGVNVLIVDDEEDIGTLVSRLLKKKGYEVKIALNGMEAEGFIREIPVDVALVDLNLPDTDGFTLLRKIKNVNPRCEVILMTGNGTPGTAEKAVRSGAFNYLGKPFRDISEVETMVERAASYGKTFLQSQPSGAEWAPIAERLGFQVGRSAVMCSLVDIAYKIAKKDINILIQGETGTGKEMLAKFIHAASNRSHEIFIPVNCGALPKDLVETELFGHEKGAFTGAVSMRRGLFEMASGGTLFLDEIGEVSPAIQVKLLRVLETGEFLRVGGEKYVKTDVRLIAATNVDLRLALQNKTFREDLFYRLEGMRLEIPPLRERREDIPLLAEYFVRKASPGLLISSRAVELLCNYSWPGNVRELSNIIHQAVALCDGNIILPEHLSAKIAARNSVQVKTRDTNDHSETGKKGAYGSGSREGSAGAGFYEKSLPTLLERYFAAAALEGASSEELMDILERVRRLEKRILHVMREKGLNSAMPPSLAEAEVRAITEALDYHQGIIVNAARSLGIGRNTLSRKIKQYGIKIEKRKYGCSAGPLCFKKRKYP